MSSSVFDRFSPMRSGTSSSTSAQSTPERATAGVSSPQGLTNTPQLQKILKDVLDCIDTLKTTFHDDGNPIDDNNQTLHRFCAKLEFLLQFDMKERKSITGRKKDYWDYFCTCIESVKGVNDGIKYVKTVGDCKTSLGRGRAFLRFCLMHHRLADSLQQCVTNGKATSIAYGANSIWLQHEKSSGIISALYDLNDVVFDLAPRGYDLDISWPSFARKNLDNQYSWALSERSRTSSMSSLNSVDQEIYSPSKTHIAATLDVSEVEQLTQELAISENVRSDLTDKMEALEQQKSIFQQSIAESRGELNMLETQHKQLQAEHKELQNSYRELEKKYDKQCLESNLSDKDNQASMSAAENKLQKTIEEAEHLKDKLKQLEEDLQLAQENLQITLTERDTFKTDLEAAKEQSSDILDELQNNKGEFDKKLCELETERDELTVRLKQMEDENVVQSGNTAEIQSLLDEKTGRIEDLEKSFGAMKNGYIWLQGIKENQTYNEICDLDAMAANILKDLGSYIKDLMEQKTKSYVELELLASEKDSLKELAAKLEEENNSKIKTIDIMEASLSDIKKKNADMQENLLQLEETLKLEAGKTNSANEELKEKERIISENKNCIQALTSEKTQMCNELEMKQKDLSVLQADVQRSRDELQKTNDYYNMATKGQSELLEKLSSLEKQILEKDNKLFETIANERHLTEEKMSLQREVEIANNKNGELEKELSLGKETYSSCQIKLEQNRSELENVLKNKKDSDTKLNQLQKRFTKLEKDHFNMKDTLTILENEKESLETQIQSQNVEMEEKEESFSSKTESLLSDLDSCKSQIVKKDEEIALLKSRLTTFENQIVELNESEVSHSEKVNSLEKELRSSSMSIVSLEKDRENLSKENSVLKTDKENTLCDLKLYQNETYEKKSEILLLNEKLERAHADMQRMKEFYEHTAKTESDLSERFSSLENSLKEKDNKILELNETEKGLAVEITKLERDNLELEEKCKNLAKTIEETMNSEKEKQTQIENLTVSRDDIQLESNKLVKQVEEHIQKEKSYKGTIEDQNSEIEKTLQEITDLQQEIEAYRLKETKNIEFSEKLQHKVFELEQRETQVKKQLDQMKEDFDIVSKEKDILENKIEDLEENILANEKDIDALNLECTKMISVRDEMLGKFSESEERNRELCKTVDKVKLDYDTISRDKYELEEKTEGLEKELLLNKDNLSVLSSDLSALDALKNEIQTKLEFFEQKDNDSTIKIETLNKQVLCFEETITELNGNIQELKNVNREKSEEFEYLKTEFNKVSKENDVREVKVTDLLKLSTEQSEYIGKLEDELCSVKNQNDNLEADKEGIQKEKECLADSLKQVGEDLSSLNRERDHLKSDLEMVSANHLETCKSFDELKSEYGNLKEEFNLLEQLQREEKDRSENFRIENIELTTKAESMQLELSKFMTSHQESEEKVRVLMEVKEQLEMEKYSMSVTISNLEEQCKQTQDTLDESFSRIYHILYDYLEFSFENKELQESQTVNEKMAELIGNLDSVCSGKMSEMQELYKSYDSKCTEVSSLQTDISNLHMKEKNIENRIEEQNVALKEAEKIKDKLHETMAIIETLTEIKTKLIAEKESLSQDLETEAKKYQGLIDQIEKEREQTKQEMLAEKKEVETLVTKSNEDKNVISSLNANLERLQKEKDAVERSLSDQIISFQTDIDRLSTENTSMSEDMASLIQSLKDIKTESKEKDTIIDKQKNDILESLENNKQLQGKLLESVESIQSKDQALSELNCEIERRENELKLKINDAETKQKETDAKLEEAILSIQSVQLQLEQKSSEFDDIYKEKESLEERCLQVDKLNEDLNLKNADLHSQLNDSNAVIDTTKQELESSVSKLEETGKELCQTLDENEGLQKKFELAVENCDECQKEKDKITSTYLEIKCELELVQKQYNEKEQAVQDLTSEANASMETISTLRQTIDEAETIITEVKNECSKLREEIEEKCFNESQMDVVLQEKDGLISDLQKDFDEMKEKLDTAQSGTEVYKEEVTILNEKIVNLENVQSEYDSILKENKILEDRNKDVIASLDSQNDKCSELTALLDLTKQELTQIEEKLEEVRKAKETETESLRQEITALEFQLSSEQLQNQEVQKAGSVDESEFTEMKEKLMEQESIIDDLQKEMEGLRILSVQHKEQAHKIQDLEEELESKEDRNKTLEDKLQQIEANLSEELESSQRVKLDLDDERQKLEESLDMKDREIEELKEDVDQLKRKLVKLIKEKDTLWQKTDRLAHQHKLHVTEKWMDNNTVTNCLSCNTEFSFTLRKVRSSCTTCPGQFASTGQMIPTYRQTCPKRPFKSSQDKVLMTNGGLMKHHCRLCGRIFCYSCSNHWVMTASSSKKLRACTACYIQYSTPTEESKVDSDIEEQSVEIPKRRFIGQSGSALQDTSSLSMVSSTGSLTDTEKSQEPEEGEAVGTSDVVFTVGNETDEDKLKDNGEKEETDDSEDRFHVISDEEIQRSLTMSAEVEPAAEPEPSMSCSMFLNLDELENGDINSQNEVWIKAGKCFAVPVEISKPNTVFGWEFTSYPKDVVFSATYRQTQSVPYRDGQILVPPCKCDSHKEATRGELTAKQPGIYTLIFDNTYSKMTAKRVNYSLYSNSGNSTSDS